ncbi:5'-methylthioadenosine/adenosylhomocysteine nucleosidase [Wenyingzhuangia aestuarii]|uniref:5'-methylthioadenosine/adenosylhomocysteine nucleosidase n=1 Tax=Wenyingzhuangia aestuarii TaxID=1647582 RepID=UPI00143C042D|nr:5'-methylthioadenosine/adenosylhomocysteine nucleosidase [Wenyingzhuangia aestuarii]NJB83822.1 adenosylhomocysteine nucleosidase [Wenyingzhuangia aestuarii]
MIGIISAMHDELAELLCVLKNKETVVLGNREYYTGTLQTKKVVLVFSKWGKVAAAITTTQLISRFSPSEIIFTGVAGAMDSQLNIGDLVYGTSLVQHDMDASPLFPKLEIPLLGITYINTNSNKSLFESVTLFQQNYLKHININEANEFGIQSPKIVSGIIASGDEFVSDANSFNNIKNSIPNLQCVEMEGAAVAQVCYEYKIPFSIIRIISDKADHSAPVDFPIFTKKVASKYAKGILENYCS